jgi:hypothetical protein
MKNTEVQKRCGGSAGKMVYRMSGAWSIILKEYKEKLQSKAGIYHLQSS